MSFTDYSTSKNLSFIKQLFVCPKLLQKAGQQNQISYPLSSSIKLFNPAESKSEQTTLLINLNIPSNGGSGTPLGPMSTSHLVKTFSLYLTPISHACCLLCFPYPLPLDAAESSKIPPPPSPSQGRSSPILCTSSYTVCSSHFF